MVMGGTGAKHTRMVTYQSRISLESGNQTEIRQSLREIHEENSLYR
jgi:hypothetical protein